MGAPAQDAPPIRTPDQRLRVFVSSTLKEVSAEREAVRAAVDRLRFTPVMFELGARPHGPRDLYRAYLAQSDLFVGVYWQSYGWVAPGEATSGLQDEYERAAALPRLVYVKAPAPDRDPRLEQLLDRIRNDDGASYKRFSNPEELRHLVADDIAVLLSERFDAAGAHGQAVEEPVAARPLPLPATPLVGRETQVRALERLMGADDVRLVTLTGPGGVGKSRLALEVASRMADRFADGVALAELAPVADPDRVAQALAVALGRHGTGTRTPIEDVKAALRDRELLLVIDNFEHVTRAAPLVAELLAAAPGLKVVTTSRTPLRLSGERGFPVPPLSLPPSGSHDAERLQDNDAVRLFVQRAQAADPRFELTAENAAAVAEISRRLDGLPLALELAAARIRLLPVQTLLRRLEREPSLLSGGARDRPERQRTLHNAIAWSFDLLQPQEQSYLARLAVFAGGFDLEAAEAVFGCEGEAVVGADGALEALAGLVDSSLVRQEERDGRPRFSLLETIRGYAHEQLCEGDAAGIALDRHAAHYLSLARQADRELTGPGQLAWLDRLEGEHDNLRAALARLLDEHEAEAAVELVWGIWRFWWLHGHLDEGADWAERILADRGFLSPASLAMALNGAAAMAFGRRDFAQARGLAEESLPLLRAVGNRGGQVLPMAILGRIAAERGDLERSRELLEGGVALSRETGDDWWTGLQLNFLGQLSPGAAGGEDAIECFSEALTTSRRLGDRLLILVSLYNLALSREDHDEPEEAILLLEEGLELAVEAGDERSAAHYFQALGVLAAHHGDAGRAGCLYGDMDALGGSDRSVWLLATTVEPPVPSAEAQARMATATFSAARQRGRTVERRRLSWSRPPGG